ncbi:response regulator transcription factor [Pedobacter frigidisoli]|uniref:Response regulator transcription factor n=1 Tax=Pedobacter frigidisoli TaxID=2530455 RepID=A0A4V2MMD6_9SPHI|nr:LytTR family DNA-binding domain-containing protein [Pedobacter frigidisoli]TCD05847.1 response regulator transcription factor [Pedobacter frigidisoli]
MTPLSCVLIDDDPAAIIQLTECISNYPNLNLVRAFTDPIKARKYLIELEEPIDILFTDVEMPGMSGIDLVREIKGKYRSLILVSGHLHYALDGYDLDAQQFLSKPFDYRKFEKIVSSVISKLPQTEASITIKLSGKNRAERLLHRDIIAIESASNYLKIHTTEKTYVPYGTLSEMQALLKPFSNFRRISRSVIINTNFVKGTVRYKITLDKNMVFTVGESYRKEFNKNFANYFKKKCK